MNAKHQPVSINSILSNQDVKNLIRKVSFSRWLSLILLLAYGCLRWSLVVAVESRFDLVVNGSYQFIAILVCFNSVLRDLLSKFVIYSKVFFWNCFLIF